MDRVVAAAVSISILLIALLGFSLLKSWSLEENLCRLSQEPNGSLECLMPLDEVSGLLDPLYLFFAAVLIISVYLYRINSVE